MIKSICVYCGSSDGDKAVYLESAFQLGQELAKAEKRLVYGGGGNGLMGAVAKGALSEGGKVLGIIPKFLMVYERSVIDGIETVFVEDMHTRKQKMFEESDCFIALPGGIGTFEEFFEIMTWRQLKRHEKPIILANINGFYDPLIEFLKHTKNSQFLRQNLEDLFIVKSSVEEIIQSLA